MVPENKRRRRLVLSIFVGIVFLLLLSLADHLAGLFAPPPTRSLLFPAHSLVSHRSAEFDVTVAISEAGIRDEHYQPGPPEHGTFRIVAVGDSFTFGWGVPGDSSWPNVLERLLNESGSGKEHGRKVEVLNFGCPGYSLYGFENSSAAALQHFRPDLLILATLQGDDLIQIHDRPGPQASLSDQLTGFLLPTTRRWLQGQAERDPMPPYHQTFALSQHYIRSQFTPVQADSYNALSARVRASFEAGLLNPALVQTAIRTPDYFLQPVTADTAWQATVSSRMTTSLTRIAHMCSARNCELHVAIVPNGPYVSPAAQAGMREVGYNVPPTLLTTDRPDQIVHDVCRSAGITCIDRTQFFRQFDEDCYFPLDGHFNENGHRQFARSIAAAIEARITQ